MAVKICRKCGALKTVQPRSDNSITYWLCMKHSREEIKRIEIKEEHLLTVLTATQRLHAA
jgi:hypothetical protein